MGKGWFPSTVSTSYVTNTSFAQMNEMKRKLFNDQSTIGQQYVTMANLAIQNQEIWLRYMYEQIYFQS